MTRSRKVFINLPVRHLDRSMEFFGRLGFTFNLQFTDATAACMVLSEEAYVMLLTEEKFKQFTKKKLADTSSTVEGLFALDASSREEVDAFLQKALDAGGRVAADKFDMGFMYGASFYDLDDHHWEIFWMDPAAVVPVEMAS